jgi:hypothetical protein
VQIAIISKKYISALSFLTNSLRSESNTHLCCNPTHFETPYLLCQGRQRSHHRNMGYPSIQAVVRSGLLTATALCNLH